MDSLPPTHFLATQRLSSPPSQVIPTGQVDTSTLAAHDFDVDTRTGFLPPIAPLKRLPATWEAWEECLDECKGGRFVLGDSLDITPEQMDDSKRWRDRVKEVYIFLLYLQTCSKRSFSYQFYLLYL